MAGSGGNSFPIGTLVLGYTGTVYDALFGVAYSMLMKFTIHRTAIIAYGFTLIEAIVAIGIMTLIGGGIVAFQKSVIVNSKVLQGTLVSQQQVRKTFSAFSAELRSAGPSANGSYAIESAGTSSIVFYSNIDNDTMVERVRYFYATSSMGSAVLNVLKKGVTRPVGAVYTTAPETITTIVYDVKNSSTTPIFTYFDSAYSGAASSTAPLAQPVSIAQVRLVKMSLAIDPNASRSPVYQTYETQVSIRNLKDNL